MVNDSSIRLDSIFGALADPTRRSIVERLMQREFTVKELAAPFDMSLPAISKHLRALETAGLIVRRNSGRNRICSLNPDALKSAAEWMNQYHAFWSEQLDSLEIHLNTEKEQSK